jgi:hypothetical protein
MKTATITYTDDRTLPVSKCEPAVGKQNIVGREDGG